MCNAYLILAEATCPNTLLRYKKPYPNIYLDSKHLMCEPTFK